MNRLSEKKNPIALIHEKVTRYRECNMAVPELLLIETAQSSGQIQGYREILFQLGEL